MGTQVIIHYKSMFFSSFFLFLPSIYIYYLINIIFPFILIQQSIMLRSQYRVSSLENNLLKKTIVVMMMTNKWYCFSATLKYQQ